jgi:signal transduction histidine kinase
MSRALLIFRDGLRANQMLTLELQESSRLASLGAMVAGIAHELNTPIGNALAVSSTLEDECQAFRIQVETGRLQRSMLNQQVNLVLEAALLIQRNLQRASDQIGAFKQVAADQTSAKRREFVLQDILVAVVQTIEPRFRRAGHRIHVSSPTIIMDSYPGALTQVITNLLENALKHGLQAERPGSARISARMSGDADVEVIVEDDGRGIPSDVLPHISVRSSRRRREAEAQALACTSSIRSFAAHLAVRCARSPTQTAALGLSCAFRFEPLRPRQ